LLADAPAGVAACSWRLLAEQAAAAAAAAAAVLEVCRGPLLSRRVVDIC